MVKTANNHRKSSGIRLERIAFGATRHIGSPTSIILHTMFFVGIFALQWFNVPFEQILLLLTTVVSLEAIYLAIFIQMTVNRQAMQIDEVSEDVEDIGEDVEEISKDIDLIQEDVKEISEDVEDIGEEIERDDQKDIVERSEGQQDIQRIENVLAELLREVRNMKTK